MPVPDHCIHARCADDLTVIVNRDGRMSIVICFFRKACKPLGSLRRHNKADNDLGVFHVILLITSRSLSHIRTGKRNGTISEHLVNRLV